MPLDKINKQTSFKSNLFGTQANTIIPDQSLLGIYDNEEVFGSH